MKYKNDSRVKNVGISLMVAISMLVSGIAIFAAPAAVAQETMGGEYGGELRVALNGQPNSLNPLASPLNEPARQVTDMLYESLGRIDPYTLEMVPWIAESWEVDEDDQSIITVSIKQGITWHDGAEVTLDDIEYSFGADAYNIGFIASMTQNAENNSITFVLDQSDSRFFSDVMVKKIVPDGYTTDSDPMGCGPYMLESTDDDSTVLVAFDDHFIGRPFLDKLTFTYYPYISASNFDADFEVEYPLNSTTAGEDPRCTGSYRAAHDLIQGEIDFIGWALSTNETTGIVEVNGNETTLVLNDNSSVVGGNGFKTWYLGFNNAPDHILNSQALRKAITYAIDKNALTLYDISGGLLQTESVISKYNLPWYNSSIDPYGFDMSEASSLLDNAGYMDYDGDGWRDLPDQTPFNFTLLGPSEEDVTPYTMSTNLITWFEMLGIDVTLKSGTMVNHMADIADDDFDMYLADSKGDIDPDFIKDLYHSESNETNLLNFAGQCHVNNESLMDRLDNETWEVQLDYTNIDDPVMVFHNGTLLGESTWTLDYDAGIISLDGDGLTLDYEKDTVNITYNYLPFDHYIELASQQMEPEERAKYIKDAQYVIQDMCPSVPMFSYKINHAHATGIYVGWVKTLGGIANYWTYTNLKNELLGDLDISISSFKQSLSQGETTDLFIKVQDTDGAAVEGSSLVLEGEGTFGEPEYDPMGGQYTVVYTALETQTSKTITLGVTAYVSGYSPDSAQMDITIHPPVNNFIVEIVRGATSLDSGNSTDISVVVTDKDTSTAISGATVVLSLSPSGLGGMLEETTGTTNSAGEFLTTLSSNNVTVDTTFRITAYVTMEGYEDTEQSTSVSVARDLTIEMEGGDKGFLGLPAPSFFVVLIMLAAMSVVYAAYRRRE